MKNIVKYMLNTTGGRSSLPVSDTHVSCLLLCTSITLFGFLFKVKSGAHYYYYCYDFYYCYCSASDALRFSTRLFLILCFFFVVYGNLTLSFSTPFRVSFKCGLPLLLLCTCYMYFYMYAYRQHIAIISAEETAKQSSFSA